MDCLGQTTGKAEANEYLSLGTGITWDNYYSAGPKFQASYSKRFKNKEKIFWGISMDNKRRGLNGIPSVKLQPGVASPPELNYSYLSADLHSISRMGNTRIIFDFSAGLGAMYLHGDSKHAVQPAINIGMTMNLRIGKNIFIEGSPLFVIPPSRIIVSPNKLAENRDVYSAWHFMPLGLRFKLD